jgi:hypothetical protein
MLITTSARRSLESPAARDPFKDGKWTFSSPCNKLENRVNARNLELDQISKFVNFGAEGVTMPAFNNLLSALVIAGCAIAAPAAKATLVFSTNFDTVAVAPGTFTFVNSVEGWTALPAR